MPFREKMKIIFCLMLLGATGSSFAQENAARNIPPSLLECYNSTDILVRDNRLPNNVHSLIAILRKIENIAGLNMDLRTLTVAILQRFRQDGIELNPSVQVQDGIVPFAPNGFSFERAAGILRLVSGNAVSFPNSSLTTIERCTLHFMLSSSIEDLQRGDESTVCSTISQVAQHRVERNVVEEEEEATASGSIKDDVETLSPQELEIIKQKTGKFQPRHSTEDPSWVYPALPPNHPDSARITATYARSTCPVENGVIITNWGPVSIGPVIAGIAAALQPETVALNKLMSAKLQERGYTSGPDLNNRWLATFAGDLAEVALSQGPRDTISVGATGGSNSSALPRWYFLTSTDNLEMTTAEIRGDLDGLILADSMAAWYSSVSTLRLSQILDMYYSQRGVFNSTMRACNRRNLFTTVAANATMADQAYSASLYLFEPLSRVHITAELIQTFAIAATNALINYVPTSMNNDLSCDNTTVFNTFNKISTHLTIILDTTWSFTIIQPYLATLLEGIEVSLYNSNFTIINGYDGSLIINSTNTLLDFYSFNSTQYDNVTKGFDLPKALDNLRILQTERLNNEQSRSIGGSSSDVVLVLSYTSSLSETDRTYCVEKLKIMSEEVPDAQFLYLTFGSKDRWSTLAANSTTDIFTITSTSARDTTTVINPVIQRISEVPKRLINSACGASFSSSGSSASFIDYVEPSGINYYRLHPNYFGSNSVTVKVQGAGWGTLLVCFSRTVLQPNISSLNGVGCTTVTTNTHSMSFACDADLIHLCAPFYLSVASNDTQSTSYQCTDATVCRYPDMRKYTISYESLLCRSSASNVLIVPIILILSLVSNLVN